jgi:hypothetical protein
MNKFMWATLVFSLFAAVAAAQETPKADLAVGYSLLQEIHGLSRTVQGGGAAVALNLNNWAGAVGDFTLYYDAQGLAAGAYTFGPRFSYRHWERITPFAQVLLGGVRYSQNGFAFGTGGGADFALDNAGRFALRPQLEYFGFHANGSTTNTIRFSMAFVFRFGRK